MLIMHIKALTLFYLNFTFAICDENTNVNYTALKQENSI